MQQRSDDTGRYQAANRPRATSRPMARLLGRMAPVFLGLGFACAAAGAAVTAVGPRLGADNLAISPTSLVTTIEPDIPAIQPGVVRLPVEPLAAGRPLESEAEIEPGDTLSAVLERLGVAQIEAARAIQSLREVYDPRTLRAGNLITVNLSANVSEATPGRLLGLRLDKSFDRVAGVGRTIDGGFSAYEIVKPLTLETARSAGEIQSSLFVDGVEAGVSVRSMAAFIQLFSYDVDFQRDIQVGDRFDILHTQHVDEAGKVAHPGDILFAALVTGGRTIKIYRHVFADGRVRYFNEQGRSTRKALLRTPIDGARISSRFGRRRHPVLGYSRMHAGIDFAAPTGTPIRAAGDGVVKRAGWFSSYGRYIRIDHAGPYSTAYAHLRRFAGGIKAGARVRQGQVIGYVGSSGRSTGPHLHYEILKNGEQINPSTKRFQSAVALKGDELKRFNVTKAAIDSALNDTAQPFAAAKAEAVTPPRRQAAGDSD